MPVIRPVLRILGPLLGILVVVTALVSVVSTRAARSWLEEELATRARLAAHSAREGILDAQATGDTARLGRLLADVVRDDRVVAAALCDAAGGLVAATERYPRRALSCAGAAEREVVTATADGEPLHRSAFPVRDGDVVRANLVLLQDYVPVLEGARRVRTGVLLLVALLALIAAVFSVMASRLTSIGWGRSLARALRGEWTVLDERRVPLLDDVRAMAQRTGAATAEMQRPAPWTRDRLRYVLRDHLGEEEGLLVVANREPYIHECRPDGSVEVQHPASGLVSALEPVMRACSGIWIAHGSGSADRESADAAGRILVPPGEESYTLQRVWMTKEEEEGYYFGFANEGLWPLCHLAYARPIFSASDWEHYRTINARFADAVAAAATVDDPIVLVQDYHFALAPRMIRERLPRATIITFWHIPWPSAERFAICPWREELIDGLLGSTVVGFHTQAHCNHFIDAVDTFVESRIDRTENAVIRQREKCLIRAYPISVEWPSRWGAAVPDAATCRREVFEELGLPEGTILAVGVDRLDYTKGIEERIEAVERLLERRPDLRDRFTFVQLAAPSRTSIPRYGQLAEAVEAVADRVNSRFGSANWQPMRLLRAHHEPERVFRFYRAADLCYVSSLHDGMNLVSKEFVSARDDERGVLVLSRFAGAAHELSDALIVNPYDLEEVADALERAIGMTDAEQGDRMRGLRAVVAEHNVYRWAGAMLLDAAQQRQRARRARRLDPGRGAARSS